uniref:Uncharacterized protein n=1 Tax=Rhizophora mucronata TaxID=61149 RepID=A0A2P2P9T3_RHIMU
MHAHVSKSKTECLQEH